MIDTRDGNRQNSKKHIVEIRRYKYSVYSKSQLSSSSFFVGAVGEICFFLNFRFQREKTNCRFWKISQTKSTKTDLIASRILLFNERKKNKCIKTRIEAIRELLIQLDKK